MEKTYTNSVKNRLCQYTVFLKFIIISFMYHNHYFNNVNADFQYLARARVFFCHSVQNNTRSHPVFYVMGTVGKVARAGS